MSKNKLFILSGSSASGKSTLLSKIVENGLCERATKYSTREKRMNELYDDIIHMNELEIKQSCDIIYTMYNNLYGINTSEIEQRLLFNNQIVIVSDIDSLRKIKFIFNEKVSIIFISLIDINIENLLKAYGERKDLKMLGGELSLLAIKISAAIKINNNSKFRELDEMFKRSIKKYLSDVEFIEFVERYNSMIHFNEFYMKNKDLFNYSIFGRSVEDLSENCCNIIKNQYYEQSM